jgi:hypothetical protein
MMMDHTGNLCDATELVVGATCFVSQWRPYEETIYWIGTVDAVKTESNYLSVKVTLKGRATLIDGAMVFTNEACRFLSGDKVWPATETMHQQLRLLLLYQQAIVKARASAASWQRTHETTVEYLVRVGVTAKVEVDGHEKVRS